MRVAVVGSGPAGFYAAGALLSAESPVEEELAGLAERVSSALATYEHAIAAMDPGA